MEKDGYIVDASKVMTFKAGKNIGLVQKPGEFSISTIDTPSFTSVELRGETNNVDGSQVTPVTMMDSSGMQVYTETVTPDGSGSTTTRNVSTTVNNEGVTTDGKVVVNNGKTGDEAKEFVTIDKGTDGSGTDKEYGKIGLDGKNGSNATITIDRGTKSLNDDVNIGVDPSQPVSETNKSATMDRITYTTTGPNKTVINHEVATLDDGFFLTTSKDVTGNKAAAKVKLNNTIKFTDGANTKVSTVESKDGVHSLHIDVNGLPVVYTDEDGNKLTKVGDKFYKDDQFDNGTLKPNATSSEAKNISIVNPDGSISKTDGSAPTTVNNVGSAIGGDVNNGAPKGSTINGEPGNNSFIDNLNKVGGTGNDAISKNAVVTTGDLKNLADTSLFFAGDSADGVNEKGTTADKNAFGRKLSQQMKILGGVDLGLQNSATADQRKKAIADKLTDGNIGVISDGTDTLTVKLAKQLKDLDSATYTSPTTKTDDGEATSTMKVDGNGIRFVDDKDTVKTDAPSLTTDGIDGGNKQITNIGSGFKNGTTSVTIDDIKNPSDALKNSNVWNNAVNVGDLKNIIDTGFKLNTSGQPTKSGARTVKIGDTINIIDGANTKVSAIDDSTTGTHTFHIDVNGLPMSYVDGDGNPLTKIGDKFYKTSDLVNGVPPAGTAEVPANKVTSNVSMLDNTGSHTGVAPQIKNVGSGLVDNNGKTIKPNELLNMTDANNPVLKNAVNIGDLKQVAAAAKTEVTGTGEAFVTDTEEDGHIIYNVHVDKILSHKDADGNKLVRGGDGKYYTNEAIKDKTYIPSENKWYSNSDLTDGKPNKDAQAVTPNPVDQSNVKTSLVNPNTGVGDGTDTSMTLDNVKSGIGGDAGNNTFIKNLDNVGGTGEDAIDKTTVVNAGDLKNLAETPLFFSGDAADGKNGNGKNTFGRKLSEEAKIVGGVTTPANLTDNNIGVVSNGSDTLTIKLAKQLTGLDSATYTSPTTKTDDGEATSTMKVDGNGIRFVDDKDTVKTDAPSLTTDGIDGGNKQITNIGSGFKNGTTSVTIDDIKNPSDALKNSNVWNNAVNVGDLKNIIDTGFKLNTSGQPTKPGATTVKIGDTIQVVDGKNTTVSAITNPTTGVHEFHIDVTGLPVTYTATETDGEGKPTGTPVDVTKTKDGYQKADGTSLIKINENGKDVYYTADQLDNNEPKPGAKGLTITDNIRLINPKDGTGATKITNVAAGTDDTDAVNVSQLKEMAAGASTEVTGTGKAIVTSKKGDAGQTVYNVHVDSVVEVQSKDGSEVTRDGDGKYYKSRDIADKVYVPNADGNGGNWYNKTDVTDGKPNTGANPQTPVALKQSDIKTSLVNPNAGVDSTSTDNSIILDNVKSGIGGDAGNNGIPKDSTIDGTTGDNSFIKNLDTVGKAGGIDKNTVVNAGDLKNLADTPLFFTGDSADGVAAADGSDKNTFGRKLSEEMKIVGGVKLGVDANADPQARKKAIADKLTDGNIGVISDGTNTLTVKLAKELTDLTSVTTGSGDNTTTMTAGGTTTTSKVDDIVKTISTAPNGMTTTEQKVDATGAPTGESKTTMVTPDGVTVTTGTTNGQTTKTALNKDGLATDGKVVVTNGKDGDAGKELVTIDKVVDANAPAGTDGEHGQIGLDGKNGSEATITINRGTKSLADGKNIALDPTKPVGKNNPMSMDRITYTTKGANGSTINHEVATLDDGFFLTTSKDVADSKVAAGVKLNNTIKINDGMNTKVSTVTSTDGVHELHIDVSGLPMTYVDKDGNPLTKIGDKFYKSEDVDANGVPKPNTTPIADNNVTSNVTMLDKNGNTNTAPQINNVGDGLKNGNTDISVSDLKDATKVPVNSPVWNHAVNVNDLKKVIDAGFKLNTSGQPAATSAATVAIGDTINVIDGANTKVSAITSAADGTHTFHIDVTGLPMTYTAAQFDGDGKVVDGSTVNVSKVGDTYQTEDGTKLVNVGGKYYKPNQLDSNGQPKDGEQGLTVTNSISLQNPNSAADPATLKNVGSGLKDANGNDTTLDKAVGSNAVNVDDLRTMGKAATTEVTGSGAAEVTKTTGSDGQNIYNVHVDKLMEAKSTEPGKTIVRGSDNKYYYVDDALKQANDGKWYPADQVGADGKPADGAVGKDTTELTVVPADKLKNSVVNPNGDGPTVLDNVKSGIGGKVVDPEHENKNTFMENVDTIGKTNGISENTVVNAGDLKNIIDTGFKLNTSGQPTKLGASTVKIGDTINIIDGANTKVSDITSKDGVHTFHIDVTGLPVTYTATKTDANGTPTGKPVDVSKVGDGYQLANGTKLVKAGDKYYTPDQLENGQPKPDEEGLIIKESVSLTQDNSAPATLERVGSGRRNGMKADENPMAWDEILNPSAADDKAKVDNMLTNAANIGDVRDAIKSITDGTSDNASGGFGLTGNNGDVKQDLGKTITVKGGIANKVDKAGQDLHVPEKSTTDQNTYVNVKDVPNADGNGTHKEMVVEIAKDLTDLDSVTVGNVDKNGNGGTVINKDGMTVKDATGNNSTSIGTGTIGTSKKDKDGNTSSTNIDGGTITSEKKDKDGNKQSTTIDGSHMTLENKDKGGKLTGPKTEVSNKGITITPVDEDGKPMEGKKVELSNTGLDNGGNKIINVDSGLGSVKLKDAIGDMLNNAVNVGDLKGAINNAQTAVDGDGAAEISKSVDDNGRPTYKVHVDKLVEAKADDGKAIVRGEDNKFYYKDENLKQGTDGKWYPKDKLDDDGNPKAGAVGKNIPILGTDPVPADSLKTSLVNPNDPNSKVKLDNIKSAIGGDVGNGAGSEDKVNGADGTNSFIDNLDKVGKDAAVTTGDLKNLADTPLFFGGDSADGKSTDGKEHTNTFDRKLGKQINIKGEVDLDLDNDATAGEREAAIKKKLSDGNIGVISNGKDTLTVKLSKDLKDLNTIEVNDSVSVGKDGDSTVIKGDSLTASSKDENGHDKVTNISSDGFNSTATTFERDGNGQIVRNPDTGLPKEVTNSTNINSDGFTATRTDSEGNEVLKTTMQNGNIAIEKPQPIIDPTTGEAYKVLDKDGNWVPAHSYTKISDNGFEIQGINQSGTGISKVRLSSEGLDNGGNRITHVAEGVAPDDAVNVSQLRGLAQNINNDIANVGANAAALAGLKAIQYDPLEPTQIMAAVGTYRGKQAAALGIAHYKNEDTMFHMGVSIGSDHTMANIGVTYKFGRTDEKKAVPDRYKAGPISSTYVLQDEMVALKEENARMRANDEKMNAAYDEILDLVKQLKQDNEEMKKKLEKLEKK